MGERRISRNLVHLKPSFSFNRRRSSRTERSQAARDDMMVTDRRVTAIGLSATAWDPPPFSSLHLHRNASLTELYLSAFLSLQVTTTILHRSGWSPAQHPEPSFCQQPPESLFNISNETSPRILIRSSTHRRHVWSPTVTGNARTNHEASDTHQRGSFTVDQGGVISPFAWVDPRPTSLLNTYGRFIQVLNLDAS